MLLSIYERASVSIKKRIKWDNISMCKFIKWLEPKWIDLYVRKGAVKPKQTWMNMRVKSNLDA